MNISLRVTVTPDNLDSSVEERVKEKAKSLMIGKQIANVGLVNSVEIKSVDQGEISAVSGNSIFTVKMTVDSYLPKVGAEISTSVRESTPHGVYADEPVETFIAMTGDKWQKYKPADSIRIKITKVVYNKTRFISLAVIAK